MAQRTSIQTQICRCYGFSSSLVLRLFNAEFLCTPNYNPFVLGPCLSMGTFLILSNVDFMIFLNTILIC